MGKKVVEMKKRLEVDRILEVLKIKGVSIALIITIVMSPISTYAGEFTASTLTEYKNILKNDLRIQAGIIKINYKGLETYSTKADIGKLIEDLYVETLEQLDGFDKQNIYKASLAYSSGKIKDKEEYLLRIGQYTMRYKNSAEELKEVDRIINTSLEEITSNGGSDYEVIKAIYNYVIDTLRYKKIANDNSDETNLLLERNILSGLNGNGVVCDAYSMLLSKMLTNQGYENILVIGEANGEHIWNMVKLDGAWYNIDPTWGDSVNQEIQERFFLVSDTVLRENNHIWDTSQYPSAHKSYEVIDIAGELKEVLQILAENIYGVKTLKEIEEMRKEISDIFDKIGGVVNDDDKAFIQQEISQLLNILTSIEDDINIETDNEIALKVFEFIESLQEIYSLEDVTRAKNRLIELEMDILRVSDKEIKTDLEQQLEELKNMLKEIEQDIINNQNDKVIEEEVMSFEQDLLNIKTIGEVIKAREDLKALSTKVSSISNSSLKDRLEEKIASYYLVIDTIEKEIQDDTEEEKLQVAIKEATEAVEKAEHSKAEGDIVNAKEKVIGLPEGDVKNTLMERINAITKDKEPGIPPVELPDKPEEPTEPVEPPAQPGEPTEPTEPVEPEKPIEPEKPVVPPTEPEKPVVPPTEPEKPIGSEKPSKPNKPSYSTKKKEEKTYQTKNVEQEAISRTESLKSVQEIRELVLRRASGQINIMGHSVPVYDLLKDFENKEVLVPISFLSDALQVDLTFIKEKNGQKVEFKWKNQTISFLVGSSYVMKNGNYIYLNNAIINEQGYIYVPIVFLVDVLNLQIGYSSHSLLINIFAY